MTATASRQRGRPAGKRNTLRLPPLRLTLDLSDPVQAEIARVLQAALAREDRGAYTQAALTLFQQGVTATEDTAPPQDHAEDSPVTSVLSALSAYIDWGDDEK